MFTQVSTPRNLFILVLLAIAITTGPTLYGQQIDSPITADVDFVSFEGEVMGKHNRLTWAAFEAGTTYYTVERASTPGEEWEEVAVLLVKTAADVLPEYQFVDVAPLSFGVYRIRAVGAQGEVTVSPAVEVFRGYGTNL